jgi:hypothetical protein
MGEKKERKKKSTKTEIQIFKNNIFLEQHRKEGRLIGMVTSCKGTVS